MFVYGRQCHDRLNGRAVGIRYDVVVVGNLFGIDFGHHKRHFGVGAPTAGIVDDYDFPFREYGGKTVRHVRARAEKSKVNLARLDVCRSERKHFIVASAELNYFARAFRTGKRIEFADRKFSFFQNLQHFSADHAGCADDGDVELVYIMHIISP